MLAKRRTQCIELALATPRSRLDQQLDDFGLVGITGDRAVVVPLGVHKMGVHLGVQPETEFAPEVAFRTRLRADALRSIA